MSKERQALVHQEFIERWADRFFEILKAKGEVNAQAWAKTFLNQEDYQRVSDAVAARRGKKGA